MRDERQPFRFADFSLLPPIATSLFMAIYGVMVQVDHAVLPVLLGLHAFCMAWAAAMASGRVASRVGFWVQRQAPDAALSRERRQWRRTLLWALGCGLLGPLVLASRLGDGQQWSSALWVLAETLLGAALGAWAGFAWFGLAPRLALWVWPAFPVTGFLLVAAWPHLLEMPALSAMLASLALVGAGYAGRLALQGVRQTVPLWCGMRQKPGVLPDPAVRTSPKRRWDALAFDSGLEGLERSLTRMVLNSGLTYSLVLPTGLVMGAANVTGWWFAALFVWQVLDFGLCGWTLLVRDEHWRLRLAPHGPTQGRRVNDMLLGSAVFWLCAAMLNVLFTALTFRVWEQPAAFAVLVSDTLLAVACAAWLRSVANRRSAVGAGALGYGLLHAGLAWGMAALGQPLERGATLALWQTAIALLVFEAARRRWMRRSLHGRSFRPYA
jgi:hypothetical protein